MKKALKVSYEIEELYLRLLKDGKVVGFFKICNDGNIFHDSICEPDGGMNHLRDYPIYVGDIDSFDQGIKVDGEWVFGRFVKGTPGSTYEGVHHFIRSKIPNEEE